MLQPESVTIRLGLLAQDGAQRIDELDDQEQGNDREEAIDAVEMIGKQRSGDSAHRIQNGQIKKRVTKKKCQAALRNDVP